MVAKRKQTRDIPPIDQTEQMDVGTLALLEADGTLDIRIVDGRIVETVIPAPAPTSPNRRRR